MQHDGLSTRMGDLWRNLDAITTIDPARGFRTAEYTRSALNRRIHLVGYRNFVMQLLGLRLLALAHYSCNHAPPAAVPALPLGHQSESPSTDHTTSNRFEKFEGVRDLCTQTSISTPRRGATRRRASASVSVSHEKTLRGLSCARTREMALIKVLHR